MTNKDVERQVCKRKYFTCAWAASYVVQIWLLKESSQKRCPCCNWQAYWLCIIVRIATMAGAWGMPTSGAWANQVEEEEQDRGGELEAPTSKPVATFSQNAAFPSLGEAVKKKDSKKEKKAKPTKMNLADFQTSYKPPSASRRPTVNDDQILSSLPTAPRTRGDDEGPSAGMGGAFKDYGGRDRGM